MTDEQPESRITHFQPGSRAYTVTLADGCEVTVPWSSSTAFRNATEGDRRAATLDQDGTVLHWPALGVSVSAKHLVQEFGPGRMPR